MTVTSFSGGSVRSGSQVWERYDAMERPKAPTAPPPRYRLTVRKDGLEEKNWPRATSTNRERLIDLLEQLERLNYQMVALEKLPPIETVVPQ